MKETPQADSNATGAPLQELEVLDTLLAQLNAYIESFIRSLPNIALAIVLLLLTWGVVSLGSKMLTNALSRTRIRRALVDLSRTILSVVVWGLGIMVAMTVLFPSVKPSSILTALGVGGIAIGFAFKDIFENFMAGAMIMLRKPMRIGDHVKCDSVEGKIEEILIRDTYVRQTDGQLVLVPNSMLYNNPVYIRTDNELRRYEITAGVAYDVDIGFAREVITKAIKELEVVSGERSLDVFVKEFNSSSVDFNVRWWSHSEPRDMHESRDQVMSAIKKALDDADIEIPFPYRTLTFKEPLPLASETGQADSK